MINIHFNFELPGKWYKTLYQKSGKINGKKLDKWCFTICQDPTLFHFILDIGKEMLGARLAIGLLSLTFMFDVYESRFYD